MNKSKQRIHMELNIKDKVKIEFHENQKILLIKDH